MTISSITRKAGPFSGNNVAAAFPFSFKVFSASDLVVVATDASGIETTKTLTTHYTVSLNADQNASPGGTVTMLTIPASGTLLTITSNVPELQAVALTNNGGFYPDVINGALDRLTILVQQVAEETDRAIKVPISSSTNPDSLVASVTASAAAAAASAAAAAGSAAAAAAAVPSGALGYSPVNRVGDTMTGELVLPSIKLGASASYTSFGNVVTKSHGTASGNVPVVGTVSATETLAGLSRRSTTAEAQAGTEDSAHMTALKTGQAIRSLSINLGTSVASTSGTAIDFVGIPSTAKRVTVILSGVSTNGTSFYLIQLGNGTVVTTGYVSDAMRAAGTNLVTNTSTAGFLISSDSVSHSISGMYVFDLQASNRYVGFGTFGGGANYWFSSAGTISLASVLDRVRITTAGGTDTFDAGNINISWE